MGLPQGWNGTHLHSAGRRVDIHKVYGLVYVMVPKTMLIAVSSTTFARTTRWWAIQDMCRPVQMPTDNNEVCLRVSLVPVMKSARPVSELLIAGAYLMGQDLYKNLISYLNEYLKGLRHVFPHSIQKLTTRKHRNIKTKNY
jgi:hypothetical protein